MKNQRSDVYLFEGPIEWNLWQKRDPPFHDLTADDTVYLMHNGESFTEEVVVEKVLAARYESKSDAWVQLQDAFPLLRDSSITLEEFLAHIYTTNRTDAGWIIAWSFRSIRPLRLLRPPAMPNLPRSGWLSLADISDERLRRWGLIGSGSERKPPANGGQRAPRQPVGKKLKAVERRAMDVAKEYLLSLSRWTEDEIVDTSAKKPYDFACENGSDVVRVEVKGLSGGLGPVNITFGESVHARSEETPMMLIVISEIEVIAVDGDFEGSGGELRVWDPWQIGEGTLRPSQYDYWPPSVPVPPSVSEW